MIKVTINGITVEVEEGSTILQAAEKAGVEIPTLCYIKDLLPEASCRMCMVEIEGMPKLVTACSFPAADGNVVYTESERVIAARKGILELLLSNHKTNCFACRANGECKLQDYCFKYGVKESSFKGERVDKPIDDSNPYFTYDPNLCILCHRCVNTCHKIVGVGAIDTTRRGFNSQISTPFGVDWADSTCEHCGNCVQACPVGALTMKRHDAYRAWQITDKQQIECPLCPKHCRLTLLIKDGKVVDVQDGGDICCVRGRSFKEAADLIISMMNAYKIDNADRRLTEDISVDQAIEIINNFTNLKK